MRIIRVDWIDSSSKIGWISPQECKRKMNLKCESVGWEFESDKESVTLISSIGLDLENKPDNLNGHIVIPRCAISKIKVLVK